MTLKWDDLKEGMICHIPPIFDKPRCNVKIVGKNGYWIRVQVLNTKQIRFDYLYNYDIESKFLTEVKIQLLLPRVLLNSRFLFVSLGLLFKNKVK